MNGTEGEAKRLEAIKIQLTGADKDKYDVYYRVHAQSYGWLGWAKNGAPSGTAGYAKRLEGIQIVVVKKGESAPGANFKGVNVTKQLASYIAKAGSSPVSAIRRHPTRIRLWSVRTQSMLRTVHMYRASAGRAGSIMDR